MKDKIGKEVGQLLKRNQNKIEKEGFDKIFKIIGALTNKTVKKIEDSAKADNHITMEEYNQLLDEFKEQISEYEKKLYNLFKDAELNCKYQKTHDNFIEILGIIMEDKEDEYPEVIENFTKHIDNENFINGHKLALEKRAERLEKKKQEEEAKRQEEEAKQEAAYQEELREYERDLELYKLKIEQQKSKGFFKKMFAKEDMPNPPEKPVRKK